MNDPANGQSGYAFALPRLVARLAGRKVRRAEFSRWETYGLGLLVFGMSCVFAGRLLLPFVRPVALQGLLLFLLPFAIWGAWLIFYYLNSIVIAAFRRLGLYSAPTNNPFQHFVIMTLTSGIALFFIGDECDWVKLLGVFWLGLLGINLLAMPLLKVMGKDD